MGRCWRKAARPYSVVVLAVAVLIGAGSAIAATTRTSAVPAKLVGKWTRKVTSADVSRAGAYGFPDGSVCTLTVKKSGATNLTCTAVGEEDGTIVPAGVNRVHIRLGVPTPDVYRWRVSGRLLTFTKVKDTVADREAAMEGVWKRK